MKSEQLRVLCIDIEGGFGGSSRSLFESMKFIDRSRVAAEVWCVRDGPVVSRYKALGIPVEVIGEIPRHTALPRFSRNLVALAQYARAWTRGEQFRSRLGKKAAQVDLVHLNHESLHGVGCWLRQQSARPAISMHVRTMLVPSFFARWQSRRMAKCNDGMVFITENEQQRFLSHLGNEGVPPGQVIYNIAETFPATTADPRIPRDGRLVVACLSNYAWVRGVDRVVDVAAALRARGFNDIVFVVAGSTKLPRSLPGHLGEVARAGGTLADYAAQKGVSESILFLGHVAEPETVLAACNLVIKPTREANPWGRDILEALAAGKPVLSVGSYDKFVQNGVTGYLQAEFDAGGMADAIVGLARDRTKLDQMSRCAASLADTLCRGDLRAAELLDFWHRVAGARQ